MEPETLECVTKETGGKPCGSVIWMHGLGADGYDFEPIVEELDLPAHLPLRFVFPHAPVRPVTFNQGMEMRAWYDIEDSDFIRREDIEGLEQSKLLVMDLIEREKKLGFTTRQIVLAGFSQGGAMALHTALTIPEKLAGILALSCYLPQMGNATNFDLLKSSKSPLLMMHGKQDPVVPYALGLQSYTILKDAGCNITWKDYEMPHSVCHNQVCDISAWLQNCFKQ